VSLAGQAIVRNPWRVRDHVQAARDAFEGICDAAQILESLQNEIMSRAVV
jgi:hypothetical protein